MIGICSPIRCGSRWHRTYEGMEMEGGMHWAGAKGEGFSSRGCETGSKKVFFKDFDSPLLLKRHFMVITARFMVFRRGKPYLKGVFWLNSMNIGHNSGFFIKNTFNTPLKGGVSGNPVLGCSHIFSLPCIMPFLFFYNLYDRKEKDLSFERF